MQTSEEVADALWSAVTNRRKEVVVGVPFKLLTSMYHTFGFNPFTIPG